MTTATPEIARSFGLSESELMQHALKSLLHDKRRELLQSRLAILGRYQVDTLAELEAQIGDGRVPEHPAWEDLITLENIDVRLAELDGYLRDL